MIQNQLKYIYQIIILFINIYVELSSSVWVMLCCCGLFILEVRLNNLNLNIAAATPLVSVQPPSFVSFLFSFMRLVLVLDPNGLSLGAGAVIDVSIAACGTMLNSTVTTQFFHVFASDWSLYGTPMVCHWELLLWLMFQLPFVALCWIAQSAHLSQVFCLKHCLSQTLSPSPFYASVRWVKYNFCLILWLIQGLWKGIIGHLLCM